MLNEMPYFMYTGQTENSFFNQCVYM